MRVANMNIGDLMQTWSYVRHNGANTGQVHSGRYREARWLISKEGSEGEEPFNREVSHGKKTEWIKIGGDVQGPGFRKAELGWGGGLSFPEMMNPWCTRRSAGWEPVHRTGLTRPPGVSKSHVTEKKGRHGAFPSPVQGGNTSETLPGIAVNSFTWEETVLITLPVTQNEKIVDLS